MITSRRHYKSNRPCLRSFPWQRCWDGLGKPVFNKKQWNRHHSWWPVICFNTFMDGCRFEPPVVNRYNNGVLLYFAAAAGMLNGENAWCWYIMYNNNNNNVTGCVDSSYPLPRRHLHLLLYHWSKVSGYLWVVAWWVSSLCRNPHSTCPTRR